MIGFENQSPLHVWSLSTDTKVRDFEGPGQHCRAMITLSAGRLAVGWHNSSQWAVTVYDSKTGKKAQDLTGFGGEPVGLALSETSLLTTSQDNTLRVWCVASSGQVSISLVNFAQTSSSPTKAVTP